jgi:hypothetical protein
MTRRLPVLGNYTAGDLQRAMRVALARAHLAVLRANHQSPIDNHQSPIGCDVRPDGRLVRL